MPKPVTPLVGVDVFIVNDKNEVLLIKRADNNLWALPGGCHNLGETPAKCAKRECYEETGYRVEIIELLGVFSSNCYKYIHYPYKENEFCHLLFKAKIIGGIVKTSNESLEVEWFSENKLPILSDGHEVRVLFGFKSISNPNQKPYFD